METVTLNRLSRLLSGHLWVFSNELASSPKGYEPGSIVELVDKKNNFLGIGYINPHSLISVRVLTRKREEINAEFFKTRIKNALAFRKRFMKDTDSFRAVFSESDLLPGLVADKYGDCLSIQFLTLGMEKQAETVLNALDEIYSPRLMVLRNDSSIRTLEGLPLEKKIVKGSLDTLPIIKEGDMTLEVDPFTGQKTGFFLDQRENRAALSRLSGTGVGLDLFCYTGPWSIRLALSGVKMTGVDSSDYAITHATKNAELNGVSDRCEFVNSDVFEFVKREAAQKKKYDYIVLDPPAFVKSKAKINEALKAYRELNAACMGLLRQGGILATSSCSYHVDKSLFMEMLRVSARDAGKQARVLEMRSQAKDHPISLFVPETEYLKCVILEVS